MDPKSFREAIKTWTSKDLLSGFGSILDELNQRDVVRSSNSPLSDYAELLFCKAFNWVREANSAAGHDATDRSGLRYQIKGRRLTRPNASRQLSAIRKIDEGPFDYLAGLLVDENFSIIRAAIVPIETVKAKASRVDYTNSWRFMLRDEIWSIEGVRDVTGELREVAKSIE